MYTRLFSARDLSSLGLPVAAGALYPVFRLLMSPIIAALAVSLSSISVTASARRLRGTLLRARPPTAKGIQGYLSHPKGVRNMRKRTTHWTAIAGAPLIALALGASVPALAGGDVTTTSQQTHR
jgi:hypothetical protein